VISRRQTLKFCLDASVVVQIFNYDGYVFSNEMGDRMKSNYLSTYFPKFVESHGLRRMRFHDLRHSCALILLANGVPLKHIQEWLGHSDFSTTANIYAHLDYSAKLTSAQAMVEGVNLPSSQFSSKWSEITDEDFTDTDE